MFISNLFRKAALAAGVLMATLPAMAQGYRYTTIDLSIPNGNEGFRLDPGNTVSVYLPRRLTLHKLILQVDSKYGNSAADLYVNGDRKSNTWLSSFEPQWTVTVEQETASIQLVGVPTNSYPQGVFNVRRIQAVVSECGYGQGPIVAPPVIYPNPTPYPQPTPCSGCGRLNFPLYYQTVMGNVSNRAIILVDQLADFTNYRDYGLYLLPVKKAAAESRAVAEARGDASAYGRPYFQALLNVLDSTEPYLNDTFERSSAFQLATELLALREHIRDILD